MIRALLFLLILPCAATAQDLPKPLNDTVSDYADLMDPDFEASLIETLQTARDETGVQIVVVTVGRIADYGGSDQSIETYATKLFNFWGVGDKNRDDGILILVAKDDREMRIELGDGYSSVYDGYALRVINREMLPAFKTEKYPQGIMAGAQATIRELAQPFAKNLTPAPIAQPSEKSQTGFGIFVALAALVAIFRRKIGDLLVRLKRCPNCGQRRQSRWRTVGLAATRAHGGQGTQTTRFSNCGHESRKTYTIPRRSESSRKSSGFGGGRSSGGGASGRW